MAICSKCSNAFNCDVSNTEGCWCAKYPPVLSVEDADCMCKACLHAAVVKKVREIEANFTVADAMENNWVQAMIKGSGAIEDIDYTYEGSKLVMTKWFHLKRGYCCGNGCRHCAYKWARCAVIPKHFNTQEGG